MFTASPLIGIVVGVIAVYSVLSGIVTIEFWGERVIARASRLSESQLLIVRVFSLIVYAIGWGMRILAQFCKYVLPILVIVFLVYVLFSGKRPR